MKTGVVVLNWNGGEQNISCLRSLESAGLDLAAVVFVDNGSHDGSVADVERQFPTVHMIKNGQNLGFCGGCNVGLEYALERGDEAVLLLNNDVIVAPDFLPPLVDALRADQVGAVGPKMLAGEAHHQIWCAGGQIRNGVNVTRLRGFGQKDQGQ